MQIYLAHILKSIALGIALAMDAFSVSIADGLSESKMQKSKQMKIALTFGFFQFLMPLLGWLLVRFLLNTFNAFQQYIPYIGFSLLIFIAGKMIWDTLHKEEEEVYLDNGTLLMQGIATSIDALSVGLAISDYQFMEALGSACMIGMVTILLCFIGVNLGKKIGERFTRQATIFGACILILIAIELLIKG